MNRFVPLEECSLVSDHDVPRNRWKAEWGYCQLRWRSSLGGCRRVVPRLETALGYQVRRRIILQTRCRPARRRGLVRWLRRQLVSPMSNDAEWFQACGEAGGRYKHSLWLCRVYRVSGNLRWVQHSFLSNHSPLPAQIARQHRYCISFKTTKSTVTFMIDIS